MVPQRTLTVWRLVMEIILWVLVAPVALCLFATLYYAISVLVFELAKDKTLVTIVEEPTAQVVMSNGQVSNILMNQRGKKFKGVQPTDIDEADRWDIVKDPSTPAQPNKLNLLQGVRWVGIPPFSYVYKYKFAWTSLEEKAGTDGNLVRISHWQEQTISHILLRFDLYATKIEGAECLDKIPLDGIILVGGVIVNPYKALFRVERWLEAVHNLVGAKMRDFFGGKHYEDLLKISTTPADSDDPTLAEIITYFTEVIEKAKNSWGFEINVIRLYSIGPGSAQAEAFIRASTQLYVATQQAEARKIEGMGLIDRDIEYFKQVAAIPNGMEMLKWRHFPAGLHAYAEGTTRAIPTLPIVSTQRSGPPTIDQED